MKTFYLTIISFFLFLASTFTQPNISEVNIDIYNAHLFTGESATICSQVTDFFKSKDENKPIYINFGGKYPDHVFTAVIFPPDFPKFSINTIENYLDKNICITGKIAEYKGKAQIVLTTPSQVAIKE